MVPTLLLSVTSGLLVWQIQNRRRPRPLIELLAPTSPGAVAAAPSLLTTDQNLVLSVSSLSLIALGHWGLPWARLLSTPGVLYLDFYFIRAAYADWQQKHQVSIATNDAVLATGLVVTRQWGAGSLFATFFFASRKLQALAEANLAYYLRPTALVAETEPVTLPLSTAAPAWQSHIDRGALPLLLLSMASTPLLGVNRALAVLLTNFGYDYRLVSPLSTLRYLRAAEAQGIWLHDPHVLDRLQAVDVLLLNSDWDAQQVATLQHGLPVLIQTTATLIPVSEIATLVADLQAQGHTVACLATTPHATVAATTADLLITVAQGPDMVIAQEAHVILPTAAPAQIQQLFTLAQALAATRQRSLYLALGPGLLNLGGIYLGRFGVITALLVDYGGAALGMLNATWLPADADPQTGGAAQHFLPDRTVTAFRREQEGNTEDGTA